MSKPFFGQSTIHIACAVAQAGRAPGERVLRGATPGRPPISSGERHQAMASRLVEVVSRRNRHRTSPWSIRASGTAKVGTMTSG